MAGRARINPTEELKAINIRVPARFLKQLERYLESARPPLSRNTWIVEAMRRELERTVETPKNRK
jgi:hypothetical protein